MTSPNTSTLEATESFDVGKDGSVDKLHAKAIGLIGVLFLTVTGAAPESAMLGNVPFAAGFGNGIYVPAAFLLATIVLTIFSVGYAAMASKVSSVGGFYSFISMGLGRDVGMAAGIASLASYSVFEASLTGLFAFFGNSWLQTHFGINVPWLYLALFVVVLTSILSYQDVQLSVKVLGAALVFEVIMLTIFDVGVFVAKGPGAFNLESLNLLHVMTPVAAQKVGTVDIASGAAAVGVFMAFWSWVGFEMAPNYAEESVNPKHIIPRSLYYSVIGLGIFYIITSWCAIAAYPTEGDMLAKAVGDSGNFFLSPLTEFVGQWANEAMALLILTSSFACSMAFHNTASRYMYSLGREGVLPGVLGKTHPTHKSPHVASVVQTLLAALWIILFAYFTGTNDPNAQAYLGVYTMLAVLGTMLLLILQAVVSIAIIVYFRANHPGEVNVFAGLIAPAIAFLSQVYLVYLLVVNLETFGGTGGFGSRIPLIAFIILGVGLVWGLALRVISPAAHARIGRMVLND
ncbi:APC family permease [Hyphomicrobium sp. B1]|uniref:APC family permease n=1 Tax=Hyphomicrobium sp. B1 TaxID=3075651 RepID=UPI003C2EF462